MQSILQCDNVYKKYVQDNSVTEVFCALSVQFEQGKSYAIIGASGSGKSTCIHMLAGVDIPTSGSIFFNKENIGTFSLQQSTLFLQKKVSLVFQQPSLLAELTVLENVMLKAILAGNLTSESHDRAYQLLRSIGLEEKAACYPAMLSGGQQQRVAILRAIFIVPEFLLVDEPTGNLDDHAGQQVIDLLLLYQKKYGMGLIMSTHNIQLAQQMDYIFKVEDKKLIKK